MSLVADPPPTSDRTRPTAPARPTLLPYLRRLWRDARTVQLGSDPATATVLEFAEPKLARLLDLLDGTRTELALRTDALRHGITELEVDAALGSLAAAGLVIDAHALLPSRMPAPVRRRLTLEAAALAHRQREPATGAPGSTRAVPGRAEPTRAGVGLSRRPRSGGSSERQRAATPAELLRGRSAARVLVAGRGCMVAPVAAALAASGVGHVDPALDGRVRDADILLGGLLPTDLHRPRAIAAAAAVRRAAPEVDVSPVRGGNATLVVHVGARRPAALATRGLHGDQVPRLQVSIRQGTVLVGPLLRPYTSPCAGCMDLHRQDRDPLWPALAAQLATAPDHDDEACALTTALAGAAFAADEVLAYLDGAATRTEGATVEITRPGAVRRRIWTPHPRCDCRRRRRSRSTA